VAQEAATGGDPVIAEMTIRPRGEKVPRGGLGSRFLRRIKVGEHLADIIRQLQQQRSANVRPIEERTTYAEGGVRTVMNPAELDDFVRGTPEGDGRSRTGRPGRPNLWYAQLAAEYVNALAHGSRSPTAEIAKRRYHDVSHIRDALHEARERGLLTRPPARGRPGGQLTPAAEFELLKADQALKRDRPTDDLWWKRRPPEE
jgi:hypothetical protein